MGNSPSTDTSTTSSVVQSADEAANASTLPSGQFTVSVSGDLVEKGLVLEQNLEEKLNEAYHKGREEGQANLQSTLSLVASQVYENVQDQISSFQEKHLEQSEKLAEQIRERLSGPSPLVTGCVVEEQNVISCLRGHKEQPMQCGDIASAYSSCASHSVKANH